jgi:glucan endo-1,3-alpha-glucosidase
LRYATQEKAPHNGLRPLFTSFIHAYKSSLTSDDMVPATDVPEGAIWYKTLLSTSSCTASSDFYSGKPAGWDAAADQLNYAILVPYGGSGTVIGCNGALQPLQAGLNFGSFAVGTGKQSLKVLDGNGVAVAYADGKYCVSSACPEGFYNYNRKSAGSWP